MLSFRPCSLQSGVFPLLPASHLFHQVRSEFHQPAQFPCVGRDSGPNAMLQRSTQCSGLAGHESHRTFDDFILLAFTHCGLSRTG